MTEVEPIDLAPPLVAHPQLRRRARASRSIDGMEAQRRLRMRLGAHVGEGASPLSWTTPRYPLNRPSSESSRRARRPVRRNESSAPIASYRLIRRPRSRAVRHRRGHDNALATVDVAGHEAADRRWRPPGRRKRDSSALKTSSGTALVNRLIGAVRRPRAARPRFGRSRPRRAGRPGAVPQHGSRSCRAPGPTAYVPATIGLTRRRSRRIADSSDERPPRSSLSARERPVQGQRAALVEQRQVGAEASRGRHGGSVSPHAGTRRRAVSTECPWLPGHCLWGAPMCPVTSPGCAPTARSRQKMRSPDLRRERSSCERLVEDVRGLGVGAALLHVGQVGLVGLDLGRRRRVLLVHARRQAALGAVPRRRAPAPRPRTVTTERWSWEQ